LAAKNYDVSTINITILNEVPGNTTTYQSIDTVLNQDDVVKYSTEFLDSLSQALRHATARFNIEIWLAHHSSTKHQSTTTLQL